MQAKPSRVTPTDHRTARGGGWIPLSRKCAPVVRGRQAARSAANSSATFPHAPGRSFVTSRLISRGKLAPPLPFGLDTPRPPTRRAGYQGDETTLVTHTPSGPPGNAHKEERLPRLARRRGRQRARRGSCLHCTGHVEAFSGACGPRREGVVFDCADRRSRPTRRRPLLRPGAGAPSSVGLSRQGLAPSPQPPDRPTRRPADPRRGKPWACWGPRCSGGNPCESPEERLYVVAIQHTITTYKYSER